MITDEMVLAGAKTTNPLAWEMTDGKYLVSDITREETLDVVRRILTAALAATPAVDKPVCEHCGASVVDPCATAELAKKCELPEFSWPNRAPTPAVGGEPVAWQVKFKDDDSWILYYSDPMVMQVQSEGEVEWLRPLYAAPPPSPLRGREELIEQCAKVAEAQAQEFLSPKYAVNQPFSTICERFACEEVARAIRALAASPPEQPADPLSDLVSGFAKALLAKLRLASANGRSGWERDDWEQQCQQGLLRHLEKGDPRDVAAYCAFMWHHGWITTPPEQPTADPVTGPMCPYCFGLGKIVSPTAPDKETP